MKIKLEGEFDLDELKAKIAELEAQPKPWPRYGDRYECVVDAGFIQTSVWRDDNLDHRRKAYGNVYPIGEAQAVVDRRKAQAKIDQYIRDNGIESGYVPRQQNYYPFYSYVGNGIGVNSCELVERGDVFCVRSYDIAKQIIDAVGPETVEMAIRGRVG